MHVTGACQHPVDVQMDLAVGPARTSRYVSGLVGGVGVPKDGTRGADVNIDHRSFAFKSSTNTDIHSRPTCDCGPELFTLVSAGIHIETGLKIENEPMSQ